MFTHLKIISCALVQTVPWPAEEQLVSTTTRLSIKSIKDVWLKVILKWSFPFRNFSEPFWKKHSTVSKINSAMNTVVTKWPPSGHQVVTKWPPSSHQGGGGGGGRCPQFCEMDTYEISHRCLILALFRTSTICSSEGKMSKFTKAFLDTQVSLAPTHVSW